MASISLGTTDIKICQRALLLIGESPISSFDGDDDVTTTCAALYPMMKEEILSIHPWNCTKQKFQLSRLTATPKNEYRYAFQMPSARISGALAIYNSASVGAKSIKAWEPFEDYILSDETALWGDFQIDIDESKFPPYIANLITYALAARLANPLTDDASKEEKYDRMAFGNPGEKRMGGYFETARQIDARFRPNQKLSNFSLLDVRNS